MSLTASGSLRSTVSNPSEKRIATRAPRRANAWRHSMPHSA